MRKNNKYDFGSVKRKEIRKHHKYDILTETRHFL